MEAVALVVEHPEHITMTDLVERTATGSLPLYLLYLGYLHMPYVIGVLLLLFLVTFVASYFHVSKVKNTPDVEKESLLGSAV
jgi:hypothetical protein